MTEELKRCPWCGGKIVVREGTEQDGWIGYTAMICWDRKNPFCPSQWVELSKEEAIKAWNTREGER